MKFFNWMNTKFNGGQENKKQNAVPASKAENQKEEFSDWPNGLLAIGTFGNVCAKENPGSQSIQNQDQEIDQDLSPDLTEFTEQEIGNLQKELTKLLTRKSATIKAETEMNELPLDRFLNCPSTLEVDRRLSSTLSSTNSDDIDENEIDRTIRVILGRCKDVRMENKKKGIGKKSISFLLKKMFVCGSGFSPSPSLRDTFQETRMEKLLRTMLSKKMYPQNSSRASTSKKYLVDTHRTKTEKEEEKDDCNWVKTDSDFIVLEM